jgi:hypothetical protein
MAKNIKQKNPFEGLVTKQNAAGRHLEGVTTFCWKRIEIQF